MSPETLSKTCALLQDVIGTDAGNRGMKCLIVPNDLEKAAASIASLEPNSTIVVLSGFPCCVTQTPPTETDGPPGALSIARAMAAIGHEVIVVTDTCNEVVFAAALQDLALPAEGCGTIGLQSYPPSLSDVEELQFSKLAKSCDLLVACERAGPSKNGVCYTMRAIDMNEKGLIAPLHRLVKESDAPFIGIGDGGNELGMGKVIDEITKNIPRGETIGCIIPADFLIAASVSNWGGYALAAAIAVAKADDSNSLKIWIDRCLPSEDDESKLLNRCVAKGCRDGVSGKVEATVDGMPFETSMQCLRDIRKAALGTA